MTLMSKNVYIDKLDDIVDEYNNTYHKAINMKPVDVKGNAYIDFENKVNDKDPKLKGYTPNFSEEIFVIKKVKNTVPWTYVINDLNDEKIIGTFYEKERKRLMNKNLG